MLGNVSVVLKRIIHLPEGIEFYEVDGQIVFPIKSAEGNVTDDYIIYLIKRGDYSTGKGFYKYGICLSQLLNHYLIEFNKSMKEFDSNGGDLGTGDNK